MSSGSATPTPSLRAGSLAKRSPWAGLNPKRSGVWSLIDNGRLGFAKAQGLTTQCGAQSAFEKLIGAGEKVNELGILPTRSRSAVMRA